MRSAHNGHPGSSAGGPLERTRGALLRIMPPRGKELEYLSTNSHPRWLRLLWGTCNLSLEWGAHWLWPEDTLR